MFNLFFALTAVLAGIAASAPADSAIKAVPIPLPLPLEPGPVILEGSDPASEDLNELHEVFVGLTDKVASFAEKFITDVQAGIDDLLKSGKLEKLNQVVGDNLKEGVQEAKVGLQDLGKAISEQLKQLADNAERASPAVIADAPKPEA